MVVNLQYHGTKSQLTVIWYMLLSVFLIRADSVHGLTPTSSIFSRNQHRVTSTSQSSMKTRGGDDGRKSWFVEDNSPFLALITEPDACDTDERIGATVQAIHAAVSTNLVCLASIRVVRPSHITSEIFENRVIKLVRLVMELTNKYNFFVVVTSDWIDAAVAAPAHGVHVKESHRSRIPEIRQRFPSSPLIGTSAHTISSAVEAQLMYSPNYFFVGTCYATQSHPDKVDLEGPTLPGRVRQALVNERQGKQSAPIVLAIGGIDSTNCHEPVCIYGADGVATIRAVLQASDPAKVVHDICNNMNK